MDDALTIALVALQLLRAPADDTQVNDAKCRRSLERVIGIPDTIAKQRHRRLIVPLAVSAVSLYRVAGRSRIPLYLFVLKK